MKPVKIIPLVLIAVAVFVYVDSALAGYDPATGRFQQQDPLGRGPRIVHTSHGPQWVGTNGPQVSDPKPVASNPTAGLEDIGSNPNMDHAMALMESVGQPNIHPQVLAQQIYASLKSRVQTAAISVHDAQSQLQTGRWLAQEQLAMPEDQYLDGMNLYQYVRSNPINLVDPYGLFGILPPGVLTNWACCSCLTYSEAGRRGENCMPAVVHVMLNRQRSTWPDFSGENSFCAQAASRRFAGGARSERYKNCWSCKGGLHKWEYDEMSKARHICAGGMGGVDPTGGAQFFFTTGQVPEWMRNQENIGNCRRMSVPACSIMEFWKCTNRPLAQ